MTVVSPAVYTITISGISGTGTLGLNLVNNGSILDSGGGSLSNSSFTGQVYTINQVWPFVESINRTGPAAAVTDATAVTFTVSFSESVTGVNAADFGLPLTGTTTATVTQVTPVSGSVYTVTVSGISGLGTVGLSLVDNGTIRDMAGNPLGQQNGPAAFQNQKLVATTPGLRSFALGDVNGDGIPDLVVTNGNNSSSKTVGVLLGNGNGTFQAEQTFATAYYPQSVILGDVNGDGIPDLVVNQFGGNSVSVLLGNGNGTFQTQQTFATGSSPNKVAVCDVNGDGIPDLATVNYGSNTVGILLGNGNGTFQSPLTFATGRGPTALLSATSTGTADRTSQWPITRATRSACY